MNDSTDRSHSAPGGETLPAHAELAATERRVRLGFAFALTCLAVIGVVSYVSVARLSENAVSGVLSKPPKLRELREALMHAVVPQSKGPMNGSA